MEIDDIVTSAQLACILEVSCPKPGNVDKYHDFEDVKYEDFLRSSIAIGSSIRKAAYRGFDSKIGKIEIEKIQIGGLIKDAISRSRKWNGGKNTHLGTVMLLIPLSAACGKTLAENNSIDGDILRENIDLLIKNTTYHDTLELYDAIKLADPGGLGEVGYLDINDEESRKTIREDELNLYDVLKLSEDSIAKELTTSFIVSFDIGYPSITKVYEKTKDLNKAILYCFLNILSKIPDSLIIRKNGKKIAKSISREADKILRGRMKKKTLKEFDKKLRDKNNSLNPGTTADIVTSSLMISLLKGIKL